MGFIASMYGAFLCNFEKSIQCYDAVKWGRSRIHVFSGKNVESQGSGVSRIQTSSPYIEGNLHATEIKYGPLAVSL